MSVVFETERLVVRTAQVGDAELFFALWTDPRVMKMVGFPKGLRVTVEEIRERIAKGGEDEFDQLLVVEDRESGRWIGQATLHRPDAEGIARTDVKVLPEIWGQRYGVEIKRGLLRHLFVHTDCRAVEGSPNKANVASIRMQEAVGGIRVGEGVFTFPEKDRDWTCPVPHYLYLVSREGWESGQGGGGGC